MRILKQAIVLGLFSAAVPSAASMPPNPQDLDFVVMSFNSLHQNLSDTLVYGSMEENMNAASKEQVQYINIGMGDHLWQWDLGGKEPMRGWMYRLRRTATELVDEFKRRGEKDFIVMFSDAHDVYFTKTVGGNGLDLLKERFLQEFAPRGQKIVFSSQIYCCNPWELRSVPRRDYDNFYASSPEGNGLPPTIYKHLNAGLYMGYASALIEMMHEMGVWEKTYHRHESYHSLVESEAADSLTMGDMEVDDDEWQLAAWYFEDQKKERPLSTLDHHQELFSTTGTQRVQERDNGLTLFSRDHFARMFGDMPEETFEIEEVPLCPYEYHLDSKLWINKFTGSSPLVFHFAGRDWLCACQVMHVEGYENIPPEFKSKCANEYFDPWLARVTEGIQYVADAEDPLDGLFLLDDSDASTLKVHNGTIEQIDREAFGFNSYTLRRMLQDDPYADAPTGGIMGFIAALLFCF